MIIGIFSHVIKGLLSTYPYGDVEEFVHLGHWVVFTLQELHMVYKVKAWDVDDLVFCFFLFSKVECVPSIWATI